MNKLISYIATVVSLMAVSNLYSYEREASSAPETWFHIIGGNASKEGLAADIEALANAGVSGIQFFHGGWSNDKAWPGVTNMIPCLSEKWVELVKFAEQECHKRGLSFKVQNCPGWSMSGGPWITPSCAMRKLVCFERGKKPNYSSDDDFHEIGEVSFPLEESGDTTITFPNPHRINHGWAYDIGGDIVAYDSSSNEVFRFECPQGAWQDIAGMTKRFRKKIENPEKLKFVVESRNFKKKEIKASISSSPLLDMWEAKAGWGLRSFKMSTNASPVKTKGVKTLVFGHVNMKRKNAPAPAEATGWECDKMDKRGFRANFDGYVGRLLKEGVKVDGLLVDSWECGCQTWTWKMEEEFERIAGYALRPWLPALFGYVLKSEIETEKFLLDWRNVCSRLVEENYYGEISRLAKKHGMSVQYETAFGDVIPGDILRYWKYSDEPMCEFWSPHDNVSFVGSYNFKPVLPCVSSAHIYGKKRISAEALTSFKLTFDENFKDWKKIVDKHFARGVTHIVFHTYTHNPVVGGKPPSTSFGRNIGSPFLRGQTWWGYLCHFTKYLERCGRELERGFPAVDILMYLGDDVNHKPSEKNLLFGNRYKYDYLNSDALMSRVSVKDGRIAFPDGMSYRVLWIPEGTFLVPATQKKLAELEKQGARIVRGDFSPDWPSPFESALGRKAADVAGWYQRRDGDTEIFFVAEKDGTSSFYRMKDSKISRYNPVTGEVKSPTESKSDSSSEIYPLSLKAERDYEKRETRRFYSASLKNPGKNKKAVLNLGRVRDWATVYVNGEKVADLWCEPYSCDVSEFLKDGKEASVRVEVVSTWYNALVEDAKLPEEKRSTWTLAGPKADAKYHDSGLIGPVSLITFEK